MTSPAQSRTDDGTGRYCLPPNLSEWTSKPVLMQVVHRVVQTVRETKLQSVGSGNEGKPLPPRMMLSLLTSCYALGIYGSENIERSIRTDENLRDLCANHDIDARLIRRFRHSHRALIAQCLKEVCLFAWKIKLVSWPRDQSPTTEDKGPDWRCRLGPLLETQILCEVMERLSRAERFDQNASNEQELGSQLAADPPGEPASDSRDTEEECMSRAKDF